MDHPFEIGGRYENKVGKYEVLEIEGNKMTIQFDDGTKHSVTVSIQAKIWQNIQDQANPTLKAFHPGQGSQAIQPVIDLVDEVLKTGFKAPYPVDITDQVCLAIEANPDWLARYDNLVLHFSSGGKKGKDIVNNNIGYYTKELGGMINIGAGVKADSGLIKTYSRLGYPE